MKISSLAVARPVATMMIFLAVLTLGLVSYWRLPVQLLPDIDFPQLIVIVSNDRSAEDNLDNITKSVEGIIAELPRVQRIRSRTESNRVVVRVNLEYGTDLEYAAVDLDERLNSFRQQLNDPRTYINSFPISTSEWDSMFMFLSVRGPGDPEDLYELATEHVEQQLRSISGVSNVELRGVQSTVVEVDFKTDLLAAYGLDFGSVIQRVQASASEDSFLGKLRLPSETWFVRLDDRVKTPQQLANVFVDAKGIVRLRDVATIEAGSAVNRWVSRADGQNAIGITMEKESGRNLIDLAAVTRQRVEEINAALPQGVSLVIDEDFAHYVEDAINDVKSLSMQGALLALLVPLIFFGSLRVALIVFLSVPISLIAVFNLFYATGMSINIFSIVGLALGVGMLVDNAIVVTENALRLWEKGVSPREAAAQGGVEVGRGLFASTLTTAVVFVPIAFLDGEFKEIVREPTLALIFPLLLSLAVALTLVPVFVRGVLETKSRKAAKRPMKMRKRWGPAIYYGTILKAALRHRGRVVFLIAFAVAFTWLESCQRVAETSTSREAGREWMEVYFRAPAGSTLSDVNRSAVAIERRLSEHPDIKTFRVSFNSDGGEANIRLKELKDRVDEKPFREIEQTMLEFIGDIPAVELSLQRFSNNLESPPLDLGNQGILELSGLDPETVRRYAENLIEALRYHPDITNARIEEGRTDPLYLVQIDRDKSRVYDVKADTLVRYLGATRSRGTVSSLRLKDGDKVTEVSFVIREAEGATVDQVKDLAVYTPTHGNVPLGEIGVFSKSRQPAGIRRTDRQSSMEVAYFFAPTATAAALTEDIRRIARSVPNPGGVVVSFQGEAQRVDERQGQFMFTMFSGAILVYVVMAAVFESFWVPFIILLTNPLMLIGIVWGLDLAGLPLDDLAAFGVILLVGLAVNNGIVMMDRALEMQRAGINRSRAIFEASLTRLRPIVMTWLTTVLGLLPLALVGEEGNQWRPVAVVIIGGLTSATVLTLVVLPSFYLLGDDFVRWARPGFMRFLAVLFETGEGMANAVMHPIDVLRGRRRVAPGLWAIVKGAFLATISIVYTALRMALTVPLDILTLLGIWKSKALPAAVDPGQPIEGTPAITATNLQVRFPAPGLRGLARPLPHRIRKLLRLDGGEVAALSGVALSLERGMFGLLGPNGAGKTTLMRVLAGLQEPARGTVRLYGVAHRDAPGQIAPLVGYLPQDHGYYGWMTLREYLDFFALMSSRTVARARAVEEPGSPVAQLLHQLRSLDTDLQRRAEIERVASEVNLSHALDRRLDTFSGGMRQRAGIARLLLGSPPIIMVDEPTAKLDPVERVKVRLLLAELAKDRLVIFSTHLVEDLDEACTLVGVMNDGRMVALAPPEDLRRRSTVSLWEVPVPRPTELDAIRDALVRAGHRVVSQRVTSTGIALRVIQGATAPLPADATPVTPNLEEALLDLLGRTRGR
ncbi:ATP-binding cassette domain-containing protein [bacterium]|nr:ATP-binding cassette domain-containing protein [bacterium]